MEEQTFAERVRENIVHDSREYTIKVPKNVYDKFKSWAYKNADNCYWLAIDKLLIEWEANNKVEWDLQVLVDRDAILAEQINLLQERVAKLEKEEPKTSTATIKRRTFGKIEKSD